MEDGASIVLDGARIDRGEVRMRQDEKLMKVYEAPSGGVSTLSSLHSSNVSAIHIFAPTDISRYVIYAYGNTVEILEDEKIHILRVVVGGDVIDITHVGNVITVSTINGLEYIYFKDGSFNYLGPVSGVAPQLTVDYHKDDKLEITPTMVDFEEETYGTSHLTGGVDINRFADVQTAIEAALARVIGGADKRVGDERLLYGSRVLCYAFRLFDGSYVCPSAYIMTDDISQAEFTGNTYGYIESETEEGASYTFSNDIRYGDKTNIESVSYEGDYIKPSSVFRGVEDFLRRRYVEGSETVEEIERGKFFKRGSAFSVCIGKCKDTNTISRKSFVAANMYNLRITLTIPATLKKWEDIISGVDFFISEDLFGNSDYRLFKDVAQETLSGNMITVTDDDKADDTFRIKKGVSVCLLYKLQKWNREDVDKNIKTISSVNNLCSMDFKAGKTYRFSLLGDDDPLNDDIDIDENKWKSHTYISRDTLPVSSTLDGSLGEREITGRFHLYNSRAHIYDLREVVKSAKIEDIVKVRGKLAEIFIQTDEGEKSYFQIITKPLTSLNYYIYVRDLRVKRVKIWTPQQLAGGGYNLYGGKDHYFSQCQTQNLSFLVIPVEDITSGRKQKLYKKIEPFSIPRGSEIAVSDPLNAFSYPPKNTIIVGRSKVRSVATTALPLVGGAYREYPLFIASDDCIYAAELNNDGLYNSVRAISTDVALSDLLSIEGGVAYLTTEGLIVMTGSGSATCVSRLIVDDNQRAALNIQQCSQDQAIFNNGITPPLEKVSFEEAIKGNTTLLYNYTEKTIIVSIEQYKASYVYSMETQSWNTTPSFYSIYTSALPYTYGVRGNQLYLLREGDSDSLIVRNMMWLSSPIKLGTDELKFIRRIKIKGFLTGFKEARFFAWMSNDNVTYRCIRALKTSGKTLRDVDFGPLVRLSARYCIVGVTLKEISKDESRITGIEIEVDKQYNNSRQMQ